MHRLLTVFIALVLALFAGCGASMGGAPMAGVTTGGAQDIGLARNQVAAGRIPSPDAFVIEGLLTEHDIDIAGGKCDGVFCINTAAGVAPALDTGDNAAFVVLGFSSGINLDTFKRRALNLSVVVDRSGSMNGAKMRAARQALHKLVRQLRPGDRFSIIAFDHRVEVVVPSYEISRGTDGLHSLIDEIDADGSTDIESAMARGFKEVGEYSGSERDDRVILITDARPNTGRTGKSDFIELSKFWAGKGVGLTVMGVGLDFGQELSLAISRIPGANYHYLETAQKLSQVFDRDFDLLVTPVAWDFELVVEATPGYRVTAAYGIPSWAEDDGNGAVRLHVPTLFLSRNRGAIVLRLEPEKGHAFIDAPIGRANLAYRTSREAAPSRDVEDIRVPRGPFPAWDEPGVKTAVMLVNTALGLKRAAAEAHAGHYTFALDTLHDTDHLVDGDRFPKEQKLIDDLTRLIAARIPSESERAEPEGERLSGDEPTRSADPRWIR